VEAARRADWAEIDALIVPHDEIDTLIKSGIRNLPGEEMTADDKVEWPQDWLMWGLASMEVPDARRSLPSRAINGFNTNVKQKLECTCTYKINARRRGLSRL
jgi:hypothetical protein